MGDGEHAFPAPKRRPVRGGESYRILIVLTNETSNGYVRLPGGTRHYASPCYLSCTRRPCGSAVWRAWPWTGGERPCSDLRVARAETDGHIAHAHALAHRRAKFRTANARGTATRKRSKRDEPASAARVGLHGSRSALYSSLSTTAVVARVSPRLPAARVARSGVPP